MIRALPFVALVLLLAPASTARAALLYSESVSGDAGVDPGYAELGPLTAGTHQVTGGNPDFDTDDYHFTIGAGLQLDAILIDSYTALGSAGVQSPAGSAVLTSASVGQDLLALASITSPIGSGGYVLRATTGTGGPTTYQFGFHVSPAVNPFTVVYNESVGGDAGVDPGNVNLGSLAAGNNRVLGGNPDFDTDDYTFTIGAGFKLNSILVESYTALGSAGMQTPALGSTILTAASRGQDVLNLASIAQPMGPGTYMFRTTTGTAGPTTYRYNMQVTAEPNQLTVRYDESVSGDAAVDPSSVNLGTLAAGSNHVIGGNLDFDTDDFTFTIAPGFQLNSILIEGYTGLGSVAFQDPVLGAATLSASSFGQDFLDLAGITQPLGPGTYLFRTTTGTAGPTTYQFDFQLSAVAESVPEPSTFVLAALGLAGLGLLAWRRKK